jgi:uncharacterized membrane protein YgdD (TMEM256/DUF423 family)
MSRFFLFAGALSGLVAVMLGAYGAHGLPDIPELRSIFQTAVNYQLFHTPALLITALLVNRIVSEGFLVAAGWAFLLGIGCFSGSIYLRVLFDFHFPVPVAPVGGIALMIGWGLLALAALRPGAGQQDQSRE